MPEYLEQQKELDERLQKVLEEKGLSTCECGRKIDRGDCSWNTGSTEAGTGYSVLDIRCLLCLSDIHHSTTWARVESFEEFISELE